MPPSRHGRERGCLIGRARAFGGAVFLSLPALARCPPARAGAPRVARIVRPRRHGAERGFLLGLARAVGGAVFLSLPLLMTMAMWELGFYMGRARLALFIAAFLPILMGLSHF